MAIALTSLLERLLSIKGGENAIEWGIVTVNTTNIKNIRTLVIPFLTENKDNSGRVSVCKVVFVVAFYPSWLLVVA